MNILIIAAHPDNEVLGAGGLSLAGHPQAAGQVLNIGGIEEIPIKKLAERVLEIPGSLSTITVTPYAEAYALVSKIYNVEFQIHHASER